MERQKQISTWLAALWPGRSFTLAPASADASFRRYFRATLDDGATRIVMDAPPANEDCRPWLHAQQLFHAAGVHVPEVIAQDLDQGFLLLSDLGDTTYLQALDADNAVPLYADAIAALVKIQQASRPGMLPEYDRALLRRELDLFPQWFLAKHHQLVLTPGEQQSLEAVFERILAVNLAEPKVFVHRDYHSRNLMITPQRSPGVIDFQDALHGPVCYDLASILKDCYIDWPRAQVEAWVAAYRDRLLAGGAQGRALAGESLAQFLRWFDLIGLQRHIKVLGIFARLCWRDGKTGYLADLPRTLGYVQAVARAMPELARFAEFVEQQLAPGLVAANARALAAART
jgi:aminoglycoside/choline kinase family phosphotransferase